MKPDLFQAPDYYQLDDLLTEEHKLVRDAAREWVKREVSPIIEEYGLLEIPYTTTLYLWTNRTLRIPEHEFLDTRFSPFCRWSLL